MTELKQENVRNRLLSAMPRASFESLAPYLALVDLPLRTVLVEPDAPTSETFFLESGLALTVASNEDGDAVEVSHIGREGMSGIHLLLAVPSTTNLTSMQVGGTGYRLPFAVLSDLFAQDKALRDFLLRYIFTVTLQLAHSALANARYSMSERLARWMLMCHDRLDGDELPITHELLALMLGVRRAGVTNEIHILEGAHLIKATRAKIRILDRPRLIEIAGASYGLPEQTYETLFAAPVRSDHL